MKTTNETWNLVPGDRRQFARSSFVVGEGQFAEIDAVHLRKNDRIVILKILRPGPCSELSTEAVFYKENCKNYAFLDRENPYGRIGDFGEYIIARQAKDGRLLAPQADVRVSRHTLTKGMPPMDNRGFCGA